VGPAAGRNPRTGDRPDGRRPAIAELGPAAREVRLAGMGPGFAPSRRGAVTGVGRGRRSDRSGVRAGSRTTSRRSPALGSASGPRSGRARADMGCASTDGADLAHSSGRPDMGRRADRASGSAERPFMGPVGRRCAAGSDLGLARTRAIHVRAASRAFMGRQQTGHPSGVDSGTVLGFARKRLQATRFGLGRACAGLVGCPWDIGAERSPGRGAILERAGRACLGYPQDPGARRACRTVVVGAIGRAGAANRTAAAAAGTNGANAATAAGRRSSMVAAGRVSSPADVPRASDGGVARHCGLAAGRGSGAGPPAVGVACGDGPTTSAGAAPSADARCGRNDNRPRRSRGRGRRPRRHRPHACMAATPSGRASGPARRAGGRRTDTPADGWRESTGRADDRVRS
jgi:hypothetical protein